MARGGGGGGGEGDMCMIGKGAVRIERVSIYTLTKVKFKGRLVRNFINLRCKTVKTLIGRLWGEG